MDSLSLRTVFDFTREEWFRAYSFDQTDEEALASTERLFAAHAQHGSDGFVFEHRYLLRLAYVSEECRDKVLALIGAKGRENHLLDKLRVMDRAARSGGQLRRWPASAPL